MNLQTALQDRNVQAFLRVIREGETNQGDSAYRMLYGGELFDDFSSHPNRRITAGKWTSTAAGAYQFLHRTWKECAEALKLTDFSPASQDIAAVFLIQRRKALEDVIAGRFEEAIRKCNREWASLPGSPYGQPVKTMAQARAVYQLWGGEFAPVEPIPDSFHTEAPVAPFLAAAIPALIQAAPALAKVFSSGSETAERNVKAVEVVAEIAKEAVGARNEQELIEVIQRDPEAREAVKKAVEANWFSIQEAGGGGIEGARKFSADVAASGIPMWLQPAFVISCVLMALPLMLMVDLLWVNPEQYQENIRTQIVTGVLGVIAMVGAFWLGSSFGSQKKDERRV